MKTKTHHVPTTTIHVPTIGAIAATRALLGIGAGLLLSDKIPSDRRKQVGFALLGIGLVSTIPLAAIVFGGVRRQRRLAESTPL